MAWWNDYDRSYYGGYGRAYGRAYEGAYGGYYGRGYGGYGYERDYRVAPERSPTYGTGGDRAVRRYARSHGYDAGYPIQPHQERGWQGRWGGGMNRAPGGRGGYGNYGQGAGYRGYGDASYDWNYRW